MAVPLSDLGSVEYATKHVNNIDELLITLTAQAAGTTVYGPFYNPKAALRLAINITVITAGSLTVTLLGYDFSSGATWTAIASAALTTTGLTRIEVGPLIAASANAIAQDYAPTLFQVQCVIATGAVTATIGQQGTGA
jgi:hypothetical protein